MTLIWGGVLGGNRGGLEGAEYLIGLRCKGRADNSCWNDGVGELGKKQAESGRFVCEAREGSRRWACGWNRSAVNALAHGGRGILGLVEITGLGGLEWKRQWDSGGMHQGFG